MEHGKKFEELTFECIDLRDHPLPFLEDAQNPSHKGGVYEDARVQKWADTIAGCDGYIIVTPEYNRSTSGVLKNALDHIYGEFSRKPVGFIAYGSVGGARAVEHLRLIAIEHHMAPIRTSVHIMAPWSLRTEDGSLQSGALSPYEKQADTMLTELTWWTTTLRKGRIEKDT